MSWEKVSTDILLDNPRMTIAEDTVILPNGTTTKWIYIANPHDSAMTICTRQDLVLIQTAYSYPPNQDMYQFPGGLIDKDEDPIGAGLRELEEESGYTANESSTVSYLGYFYKDNRRSASKMHVILITDPVETEATHFDQEEEIVSEWMKLSQLRTLVASGDIVSYSVLAGLCLFDNRSTSE